MPAPDDREKHEPRNVVLRVRGLRMTKIQAQLFGMQTQQGVIFVICLLFKTD